MVSFEPQAGRSKDAIKPRRSDLIERDELQEWHRWSRRCAPTLSVSREVTLSPDRRLNRKSRRTRSSDPLRQKLRGLRVFLLTLRPERFELERQLFPPRHLFVETLLHVCVA